jgi:hypothetical protein
MHLTLMKVAKHKIASRPQTCGKTVIGVDESSESDYLFDKALAALAKYWKSQGQKLVH